MKTNNMTENEKNIQLVNTLDSFTTTHGPYTTIHLHITETHTLNNIGLKTDNYVTVTVKTLQSKTTIIQTDDNTLEPHIENIINNENIRPAKYVIATKNTKGNPATTKAALAAAITQTQEKQTQEKIIILENLAGPTKLLLQNRDPYIGNFKTRPTEKLWILSTGNTEIQNLETLCETIEKTQPLNGTTLETIKNTTTQPPENLKETIERHNLNLTTLNTSENITTLTTPYNLTNITKLRQLVKELKALEPDKNWNLTPSAPTQKPATP